MRRIFPALALVALLAAACGGDDNGDGDDAADRVIPPEDADRVAHAGLPSLDDIPGDNWVVVAQDEFDSDSGDEFLQFIEGNPNCEALENIATLQGVFGGEEEGEPAGRAQVEFEQQGGTSIIPPTVNVEIGIDESAAPSEAEFGLVRALFESDETTNCLISALNNQFSETGPGGIQLEVSEGSTSADAPRNGANIAFDVQMSFAGVELDFAMEMYFWPYGNASVQALFLGTNDTLTEDLIEDVLEAVDSNLRDAAGR